MNEFEKFIDVISVKSKDEAISIHRSAVCSERLYDEKHFSDAGPNYLLLYGDYYNVVVHYPKGETFITSSGDMLDDDAVVHHFRANPEFAETYMNTVLKDGSDEEISLVSRWYKLAHASGPIIRRGLRRA